MSGPDYSDQNQKRSAAGIGAALEPVVPRIFRFALTLTRNKDQAEDLAQATCLRALEKQHLYDGTGRFDSWCMAICRSVWSNNRRAAAIRKTASIDHLSEEDLKSLLPDAETNIFATQVLSEVMKLSEPQRAVVLLVYGEGYRYSEAAQILDVPIGTVMSRLSSARAKLKWLNSQESDGAAALSTSKGPTDVL